MAFGETACINKKRSASIFRSAPFYFRSLSSSSECHSELLCAHSAIGHTILRIPGRIAGFFWQFQNSPCLFNNSFEVQPSRYSRLRSSSSRRNLMSSSCLVLSVIWYQINFGDLLETFDNIHREGQQMLSF